MSASESSIFVATDFSEDARPALRTASRVAKHRDAPLTVLHCLEWAADLPGWHGAVSEDKSEFREQGLSELEAEFRDAVDSVDRPEEVEFEVLIAFPQEAIAERLERGDFSLAVLGATGMNRVANFFLGSVPEDIVRRSSVPVLVVPHETEAAYPPEHIVAPVDLTPCSRRSLERAIELADESDAELLVVHATPVMADIQASPLPEAAAPGPVDDMKEHQAQRFHEFLDDLDFGGVEWRSTQMVGPPHDVIEKAVGDCGADLVVMGTHGRRGFERLFLGSTATKVLRAMPCAVMTVRAREEEESDG